MNSCRTCLKTPTERDISDLENGITNDNKKSVDIMMYCLDIKITGDSKITTKLCNDCYRKIISFYEFKAVSLKNDAYLKSLGPLEQYADQKVTMYMNKKTIKHESYLESDKFGPSVIEYYNREIKTEIDNDEEERPGYVEITIKEDVESGEEPLSVIQEVKYENIADSSEKEVTEQNGEQQMFQCKACPKQFLSVGGRNKHYRTTHLGKKSKCDICKKEVVCLSVHKLRLHNPSGMRFSCATCERRFVSQAVLDLHMFSHTKDYQFQCDVCQKKFRSKGFLSKHIRQVHDKERNHKCGQCSKAFFGKDKLKEHMRLHTHDTNEKKNQICEECGKSVTNLKEHMLSHQPKDERHLVRCTECPKMFYSIGGRKKHYRTTHLGRKHECDVCNKLVVSLSDHKKRMHPRDELPYGCVECGRRCVSQSQLNAHTVTHTRDFRHECDVCQKKFSRNTFLAMHKRAVHEKEKSHQCELCPKAFFNKYRLQEHLRSHTNERPYTCNECGFAFTSKMSLSKHMLTHSDARNFPCKLCSMSFKTSGNLSAHMVSHTKEKRYPCGFCGVRFGRSDHRNRHEFTAHKKHGQELDRKPDS